MTQPLYQQIVTDLKKQISIGSLSIGSQLPTEKQLSEMYNVSRITSKRALSELEQAGLIYRVRGKGSFVKNSTSFLSQKHAKRVLFLLPFTDDLSLGNFNEGFITVMQQHNIDYLLTNPDFLDSQTAADIIQAFDGLIYYAMSIETRIEYLFELHLKNFPVVVLDKKIHEFDFPTILSDNRNGGQIATDKLIEAGHSNIGYLFGESHPPQSTRQRYIGYLSSLKAHHLTFQTAINDSLATLATVVDYVQEHQLTAIVCENDLTAIHAMRILKQADIRVPEDISVVGFDDIQAAALVDPPLTTISQDFKKIGTLAAKTLINWIETGERPADISIPVTYINRDSTTTLPKQ